MSKTVQLELPGFRTTIQFPEKTGKKGDNVHWWYLAHVRRDTMLSLDDSGNWIELPHDTVRYRPHFFNSVPVAMTEARRHPGFVAKRWPWSSIE